MRVLIAGHGYVGQALGAQLAREGHEVFGLCRSRSPQAGSAAAGASLLTADITRPDQLATLPGHWDWVVNCASSSRGGLEEYRAVYLQGMRNLIEWLSPAMPQKFVYTSSTSVYGQTDGSIVTEASPADPPTDTGRVLVEAERLLLDAAQQHGLPAVVLRVAGIYGPGRGYWFKQYLAGTATIEGAGQRVLNMIHRDDVAGAITAALRKGRPGQIYNAVDDEPVTQLAFFQWLSASTDRPLPPFVPEDPDVARKRGLTNKRVSNRRLKEELGYCFQYPTFREGYLVQVRLIQAIASARK